MRRTRLILGFTAFAPLAIVAATVTAGQLRQQSADAVNRAMTAARAVNTQVDGALMADDSALQVLAGSSAIVHKDWPAARLRSAQVLRERTGWQDVVVIEGTTGRILSSVRAGTGVAGVADRQEPHDRSGGKLPVSDVGGTGHGCPCISIRRPALVEDSQSYLIEVRIGLDKFQRILMREMAVAGMANEDIAAVVDRKGNFIARSLDFRNRAGTPATKYVRGAITRSSGGTYPGVTYEGVRNRSAFVTSPLTGFSTHIAMAAWRFSWLGAGASGLIFAAVALALIVALVAMRFAFLEQIRWRNDQQRLIQGQKMEALGRFAGGVAHDFNNMLQVILGSLPLIERGSTDAAVLRRVSMVRQAAEKGAGLTAELLQFARDKPLEVERVELAPLLADIEGLIVRVLGKAIALETIVADPTLAISTNRAALEMALLNLAGNARDAMPDGGKLRIAAHLSAKPGWVDLDVVDTGTGMPETVAARALDPFFTTKEVGKGTGLGLAQVHSLMLQSQGSIAIESAPGAGTTIRLVFPAG